MRSTSPNSTSLPIRILTHNIRYATTVPFPGEHLWPDRKATLISELLYHTRHCPAALICLQEVLHGQLLDILAGLNVPSNGPDNAPSPVPGAGGQWAFVGVGRDDGEQAGEYAPILFRRDQWTLGPWSTTWLSPTPGVPGSKGWDAASVRIVTAAKLSHRAAGTVVLAMNTHLDDQGAVSRKEAAKMLVRALVEGRADWGDVDGAFLAGDLNSEVAGGAYRVLNEEGSGFVDMERLVGRGGGGVRKYGDDMTFTGFDGQGDDNDEGRTTKIDFIHLSTKPASEHDSRSQFDQSDELGSVDHVEWQLQSYAVLPNKFENGVYLSDHRAVVGDVTLPAKW